MMSQQHIYSLIEDDDEDSSDVKEVMPCPPYMSPGSYGVSSPRFSQHQIMDDQIKIERGHPMDTSPASNTMLNSCVSAINNHMTSTSSAMSGHSSVKQREVSEYTYAQALLKQAPKLTSTGDLDRTSVLRLAQAYITLQQGLQCWENSGNRTTWWPDYLDGGTLTLAAQETMNCFVLIMTSQGNVVYVSDAVESLLGHDQLNLVGRTIQTLVHPEEMPVLAAQFHLIIGPSGRQTLQRSFYTRMLNLRRSGTEHQQFELVHIIGHLQDVSLATGQSGGGGQRETWLMCACRVMSPLVEKEGSGSTYTEWVSHNALDGKILYMDARSCQVTGYLPNEMVGRSTYCFIHQDDQEHVAFSHKQALINVGGSSSTYRMYRRSNDLVYVHTTTQLARDKHSNKPKFLFCVNHVVDEQEGKLQVSRHQQDLMWDKSDPSIKYSMTDIERTVKALEAEGGNSPPVVSKGGMKMSKLTESCSADGGDLLSVNIPALLRVPPLLFKTEKDQWSGTSSTCHQQGAMKSHFNTGGQYQHQGQALVSSPLPGAGYGGSYGFDNSPGNAAQQGLFNRSSQQQQQTQGNLYGSQRHPYQSQVTMSNSSSMCHNMMSGGSPGDSPVSVSGTGSYVDYLYDNSGSPSVPSDVSLFNADALLSPSMLTATGRARGRGRTRGRPRGSGRGGRGVTRGVRGSRGPRGGRGSRGRGRGANISQLSQMGDVMGTMKKPDGMVSCGSMSPISVRSNMSPRGNISPMGSPGEMFPSPNSNVGLQRSTSTVSNKSQHSLSGTQGVELQRLYSDSNMQVDIRSSSLQRMVSDDSGMFQRMTSLDGIDMLDASSDFGLPGASNDDLLSPNSWCQDRTQSAQVSSYRTPIQASERVPEKKVGRPRGSRAHHDRHQHIHRAQSVDDPMSSLVGFGGGGQQSSAYSHNPPFTGQNSSFQGHGARGGGGNGADSSSSSFQCQNQTSGSSTNNSRSQDNFQRSISFQGQAINHMTTTADTQDPEHSILGNLLKGRGGSTSTTGSKSPAHTMLTSMGRSPGHSMGLDKSGRTPALQSMDKGCRSPAHPMMSEVSSPVSVFSPDPSQTSSFIKDEPDLISPIGDSSVVTSSSQMFSSSALQSHQQGDISLVEQGDHKSLSEMQMFSTQLRQKHKNLERSLESQDDLIRQLESKMQQVTKDLNPESVYSKLNARLEIIKSNKSKQEKELRAIQARLEDQVRQQQQHQLRQQQLQQQLQLQQLDLQRHRLNSPALTNTRRMAIVPPIQRQPTEGDLNPTLSQHGMGDVKPSQCAGMQHENSLDLAGGGKSMPVTASLSDPGTKLNSLQDSRLPTKHRQDSTTLSVGGPATQNRSLQHQSTQPSPYSLHHHHHHHHHYHHHPIPPPCLSQQQHVEFSGPLKGTPPPPPPPYGSFENSMFSSALAPGALSISVTTGNNSLSSPIICDTSPVSVDESPSCASDASSGYHSLSHGVEANNGSTVGQYAKAHCLDMPTSTLPPYSSKTPPSFGQSHQGSVKSPDFMSSSKSPST